MKRMMGGASSSDLDDVRFDTVAGVIQTSFLSKFKRQLFRSTRGNCYMQERAIAKEVGLKDPETQEPVDMSVFLIFFRSQAIRDRVVRVVEAFGAHSYTDVPDFSDRVASEEAITTTEVRIHEVRTRLAGGPGGAVLLL
jgi:V-type H+-transporting ATPase subunit a